MPYSRTDTYLHFERTLDRYLGLPMLLFVRLLAGLLAKKGKSEASRKQRILFIKLHGIGNLVMLYPAVKSVRRYYPDSELHFLTFDTNQEALELMQEIDRGFLLERKNLWSLAHSTLRFLIECRKDNYDIIFDFEQFAYFSSILSVLASPSGRRIGFDNPSHRRASAYNMPVAYVEKEHMSAIFLKIVEAIGVKISLKLPGGISVDPSCNTDILDTLEALGILGTDTLIVVHPGTSENLIQRRWPPARFAALADLLIQELDAKVIFTGTVGEEHLIEYILDSMNNKTYDLSGALTLRAFAALCKVSEIVVANDTAAVHIADAVGTPVVGLYGPNTPFLYGPRESGRHLIFHKQLPCSPCLRNTSRKVSTCKSPTCMDEITIREVITGIRTHYFDAMGEILPMFKKDRSSDKLDMKIISVA